MQRTKHSQERAGGLVVLLVLVAITVICGAFLAFDVAIPEWFVLVGRWLPAIIAAIVIAATRLEGGWARWFALRPGGWRRLLAGSGLTILALLGAYGLSALVVVLLGLAEPQPWSVLGQVAILLVPMILVFSLSTLGEEAAWRGFLQQAFAGWGFWRASSLIAGAWVLFHVPLHGLMAIQGTIPAVVAVITTLGLFPLGLLFSAVAVRFGSVWPAVFGHALPLSTLNLLRDPGELAVGTQWVVGAIAGLCVLVAAMLFARGRSQRRAGHYRAVGVRA